MADLTEEEILDELHSLDERKQKIRERMLELNRELTVAQARKRLDAMTGEERSALLQVVQAEGIQSGEVVS